ncbi:MAG: hypothetical protein QOH46_1251 [Solirubrobacteraceae bacterium]|nr:hypothetical protein [Solirubrobacteraceae bacterium]
MRRLLALLAAAAALLVPAAAIAQPPPLDPAPAALRGTPYLVRAVAHRVTLYVRLSRELGRRFDGEALGSAAIDGRIASLAPVAGRRGLRAACYSAGMWLERPKPGRLVGVSVLVEGAPPVTLSALVAIRAAKPGDERGAPLRC